MAREREAISHAQVGADRYPGSARASQLCLLGVLSHIKLPVSKGGVRKSEQSCLRKESEKLSIALELSQRGGEEAYVELVLQVSWGRGVQPSCISSVLRSGWHWEMGLLLFYLDCRVPQGSHCLHFTSHIPLLPTPASLLAKFGTGGSCLASIQLLTQGNLSKTFQLSFLQGKQLFWL